MSIINEVPEQSLNPPDAHFIRYCDLCNLEIYRYDDICTHVNGDIIHDDCRNEHSKQFYKFGKAIEPKNNIADERE